MKRTRIIMAAVGSLLAAGLVAESVFADQQGPQPVAGKMPGKQAPAPSELLGKPKQLQVQVAPAALVPADFTDAPASVKRLDPFDVPNTGAIRIPSHSQPLSLSRGLSTSEINLVDVNTTGAIFGQMNRVGSATLVFRGAGQGYIVDPVQNGFAYAITSVTVSFLPIASQTVTSAVRLTFYNTATNLDPTVCTTDVGADVTAVVLADLGFDKDGSCQDDANGTPFETRRIDLVSGQIFDLDAATHAVSLKAGASVLFNTSPIAPAIPAGNGNASGVGDSTFFFDNPGGDWRWLEVDFGTLNEAEDDIEPGPVLIIPGTCIDPSTVVDDDCIARFNSGPGPQILFNVGSYQCPTGDNSGAGDPFGLQGTCPLAGTVSLGYGFDLDEDGHVECDEALFGIIGIDDLATINFALRGTVDGDCDRNGNVDAYDLAVNPALDDGSACPDAAAGNGIIDSCECQDCNSNGVPDACDTSCSASFGDPAMACSVGFPAMCGLIADCNSNGIPDDCELGGRDCNNNGLPDDCDIAGGTSEDCQPNFLPDECDTDPNDPDGNGNFFVDCDGYPDGNINVGDGVPDSCQRVGVDCNANGVDDFCDIVQGVSNDFDANGVPDECDEPNTNPLDLEPSAMANFNYNLGPINEQPFVPDAGEGAYYFRDWLVVDFTSVGTEVNTANNSDVVSGNLGCGGSQLVRFTLPPMDVGSNTVRPVVSLSPLLPWATTTGLDQFSFGLPTRQETTFSFRVASGGAAAADFQIHFNSTLDDFINGDRMGIQFRTLLATDCNNNGLADLCDIACSAIPDAICGVTNTGGACGMSTDFDSNGIPDDCQTDCNTNGVPDGFEVAQGQVNDTNNDGIPDGCQPSQADCNNNMVADGTDIAMGTSVDCDANLTPDECEIDPNRDRNGNGVPDVCDIATCGSRPTIPDCNPSGGMCQGCVDVVDEGIQGIRAAFPIVNKPRCDEDVDSNGLPDECSDVNNDGIIDSVQLANCNGNHITDGCDACDKVPGGCQNVNGQVSQSVFYPTETCRTVWGNANIGTENDCQDDTVPDSCQLSGNDVDTNGVPDDCQADCNTNGTLDVLELAGNDCDSNGVLDECDPDCDTNGVVDACDIGNFTDCNSNNIPDACDTDCDNNGVVDECDGVTSNGMLITPNFPDCNTNLIPDACDEDCDNDGIPDVCGIDNNGVLDCNGDCIPDSCQIAENDCNMNMIVDECENPIAVPGQVPGCLQFNPGAPITPVVATGRGRVPTPVTADTVSWTSSTGVQTISAVLELPQVLTASFPGDTSYLNSTGELFFNGQSLGKFRPDLTGADGPFMENVAYEWADNLALLVSQVPIQGSALFPSDGSVDSGLPTDLRIDIDCFQHFRSAEDITCADLLSTDCDANGVCDSFELAAPGADQNGNGLLDVCEGVCNDCNLNNIPDDVEIAGGTAMDGNGNGVPDVCDITTHDTDFESPDFDTNGGPTGAAQESIDEQQGWAVFSDSATENFARIRQAPTASTLGFPTVGTQWLTLRDLGGGDTDSVAISPRASLPDSRIEIWCWNMTMTSNGFGRFMVELADLCEDGPLAAPTLLDGIDPNPGGGDGEDQPGEPYFDAINTGMEFRGNNDGLINPNTVSVLSNPGGGKDYGVEAANQSSNFASVRTACLKIKNNTDPTSALVEALWASGVVSPPFNIGDVLATGRVETGFPTGGDRQIIFRHANEADGTAQMFVDNLKYYSRPDCDHDELSDSIYIGDANVEQDANNNGILDRCEDCDNSCTWTSSGVQTVTCLDQNRIIAAGGALDPDPTCPARGGTLDCNSNCIPDDCDVLPSSSVGHFADFVGGDNCPDLPLGGDFGPCDVFREGGGSCDSDADGTPDECQVAECPMSSNGCLDCNENGCLDSGDIAGGTSDDINTNERPDECDGDCNVNGVLDPIDISGGTSTDVNTDDIPDECCTVDKDGDFDQDGNVDDADYQFLQLCEGLVVGGDDDCGCADLNDDGFVNEIDVLLFQRLVTGP